MKAIGHNELYKMGFDGAAIETLRRLTPEQVKQLIEILHAISSPIQRHTNSER